MSRLKVPDFIQDVTRDPEQRGILIAGTIALFAVGLVPRVLEPGLPTSQEQLKARPEIENLFYLVAFVSAATIILGGLVSDIFRRRSLFLGALVVMAGAAAHNIFIDDGLTFYIASIAMVSAAGVVLAYGIGSVAIAYRGVPRGTALGFAYGALGAGSALAPALLTAFVVRIPNEDPTQPAGFGFDTWPSYLLAAVAAGLALWAAYRWMPSIPGQVPAPRVLVASAAVWAISILAIVVGVIGLGGPGDALLRYVLIAGGAIGIVATTSAIRRARRTIANLYFDTRALGAALAVGVTVGVAQAVPLMLLPIIFEYVLGFPALLAIAAIAPFAIALFVGGPISGALLRRYSPRLLMAAGTAALGIADVAIAWTLSLLGEDTNYLILILPLIGIGAGFVISTTVRTAIVFASTPRGLPSSAAAINEASVALGSRIGIVGATALVATIAVDATRTAVAGRPDGAVVVEHFREALQALGTPRSREIFEIAREQLSESTRLAYVSAYVDGVSVALVVCGLVGLGGALLAWFLVGRRDPLHTVFDLEEERQPDHAHGRLGPARRSRLRRSGCCAPRPVGSRRSTSSATSSWSWPPANGPRPCPRRCWRPAPTRSSSTPGTTHWWATTVTAM